MSDERWLAADQVATCAAVVADPTRARMAEVLMDGRAWTVGELARRVGVAASTATEHAHHLVSGGWCHEVRQGRHRYLRLVPERAALLEGLGIGAPARGDGASSLGQVRADAALRRGRTCYRHLAGELGVAIADGWRELGLYLVDPAPRWTDDGNRWLARIGVATDWRPGPAVVRECLDWTQRTDHVAGQAADRFCTALLDRGWLRRGQPSRVVVLTGDGRRGLHDAGLAGLP